MKAISFDRGEVCLVDRALPEPGPGEALVRVLLAGICATDIQLLHGYQAFSGQPGHEFVGTVERCEAQPELAGRRVVADINVGCATCRWCRKGMRNHCPSRQVLGIKGLDGAFAEYVCLPADNLYPVDPQIPDQEAVLAEPMAAALRVTQQMHLTSECHLAVLGDGTLGLLSALSLSRLLPEVTLIGKHASKLAVAGDQGLQTCRLESGQERQGAEQLAGRFDVVVEATGRPQGLDLACGLVRPGGTVVLKTTTRQTVELNAANLAVNEIRLLGSRCGDMRQALHVLRSRSLHLSPLLSQTFPFSEFPAALEAAQDKGSLKILLDFG